MKITIQAADDALVGGHGDWKAELRIDMSEDHEDVTIDVVDVHSSDTGVPMSLWEARRLRWSARTSAGVVSREALVELSEKLRPLLYRVAAGHTVDTDVNGRIRGFTDEDAEEASADIEAIVSDYDWTSGVDVWDAGNWTADNWKQTAEDLGLTADSDAVAQQAAADKLEAEARTEGARLVDTAEAIAWMVEKLAEERDERDEDAA